MKKSYISPKVELRNSKIGKGLFAKEKIFKGELVVDFSTGPGSLLKDDEYKNFFEAGLDYGIQVDEDAIFAAIDTKDELEDADFINHSCDPNCGIKGSLQIIAMRDIEPEEEIAFDYAMSESTPFSLVCECGAAQCRKKITGEDWKIPELQQKYKGYFSEYLQKKIDAISH